MNNKLSELSKPAAWAFKDANDVDHASITKKANLYGRHDFQPLYSQEYVSALEKRIAEFETEEARRKLIRDTWENIPMWQSPKHTGRGA